MLGTRDAHVCCVNEAYQGLPGSYGLVGENTCNYSVEVRRANEDLSESSKVRSMRLASWQVVEEWLSVASGMQVT